MIVVRREITTVATFHVRDANDADAAEEAVDAGGLDPVCEKVTAERTVSVDHVASA